MIVGHHEAQIPFVLSVVEARSHYAREASFDYPQHERIWWGLVF